MFIIYVHRKKIRGRNIDVFFLNRCLLKLFYQHASCTAIVPTCISKDNLTLVFLYSQSKSDVRSNVF